MVRRLIASETVRERKRSAPMYTASQWSGAAAPSHDGIRTLSLLITLAVSNSDHIPQQDQSGSV